MGDKLQLLRDLDLLNSELQAHSADPVRRDLVLSAILAKRQEILVIDGSGADVVIDVTAAEVEKTNAWHRETNADAEARTALARARDSGSLDPAAYAARLKELDGQRRARADFKSWRADGSAPAPAKPPFVKMWEDE